MTHEQRASLIKKLFFLGLAAAIAAGVWFYSRPDTAPVEAPKVTVSPENGIAMVLHRLPGTPESDQMAAILEKVQQKYGARVVASQVDFNLQPEVSKAQGVSKPPHVIIIAGTEKVFEFQGLWTQAKVEFEIDVILRGLKRMDKDWRPPVPGMQPKSK